MVPVGFVRASLAALLIAIGGIGGSTPFAQESVATLEAAAKDAEAAGRTKDAFDLYVRAVRALPDPPPVDDDVRLREHALRLAMQLQPKPAPPEDAERFTVRGQVLFKDAKDEKGFEEAAGDLRKAVRAAPWVPELAYNLALVEEKLGYYRAAAANLKLYGLSNPPDAAAIRAKMYEFELRREKNKAAAEKEDRAFGASSARGGAIAAPPNIRPLIEPSPHKKPIIVVQVFTAASDVVWPYDMKVMQAQTVAEFNVTLGKEFEILAEPPATPQGTVYTLDAEITAWHAGNAVKRIVVGFGSGRESADIQYRVTDASGKTLFERKDTVRTNFASQGAGSVGTLAHPFADKIAERIKDAKLR